MGPCHGLDHLRGALLELGLKASPVQDLGEREVIDLEVVNDEDFLVHLGHGQSLARTAQNPKTKE